jgi:hypothetical protein
MSYRIIHPPYQNPSTVPTHPYDPDEELDAATTQEAIRLAMGPLRRAHEAHTDPLNAEDILRRGRALLAKGKP